LKEFKPIKDLSYEEAMAELDAIVSELESGERTLEETLQLFERGQALASRCIELLDKAELKIKDLTEEEQSQIA
jgi:exodeoxyribonuclease VII small subunit